MNRNEFKTLGEEFKNMMKDFANTGDLGRINRDVGSTVNNALNSALEEVRRSIASIQMEGQRFTGKTASQPQNSDPQPVKQQPVDSTPYIVHKPVGKVAGVLYTVFGSIGIGLLGSAVIILTIINSVMYGPITVTPLIIGLFILLVVSVIMAMSGSTIRNRLKRYRRYLSLFNGQSSCTVTELSTYSRSSEKFIVKDFRKMIAIGMFPQAHIDAKKTMIMLNRESYERYLAQQAEINAREVERQQQQKASERKKTKGGEANTNAGFDAGDAIEEGEIYIRQIHEAEGAITDATVALKARRLEEVIGRILEYVAAHPEKLPEVRRLMTYYLPTTVKLLNAYREFDRQPIQGDNLLTAKSEIKAALDTINTAFEKLLDSLFENAAWDVSADITVLHTILAQEGLTEESDFKSKANVNERAL